MNEARGLMKTLMRILLFLALILVVDVTAAEEVV